MQFESLISQGFDWKSRGEAWDPFNGEREARERALVALGVGMVNLKTVTVGGRREGINTPLHPTVS